MHPNNARYEAMKVRRGYAAKDIGDPPVTGVLW